MNKKLTAGIIIVGGTVLAMLAGPNGPLGGFWRPQTLDPEPSGAVLAGLMGSGLVEAIGFGAAVAMLALGRPLFTRLASTPGKATTAWLAAAWLLGSWWPHSALHMHVGLDASALVFLEVVFHAGSIVALALLLSALLLPTANAVRS
jgi:hypothetical protein